MASPLQGSALRVTKGAPSTALGAHFQAKANQGGRFASGLSLLPPGCGERPGLLDRLEVLIELEVGLAVVIHQAITPRLVAAAHRQGGPSVQELSLARWIGLGRVVVITTGGCMAPNPPCVSQTRA